MTIDEVIRRIPGWADAHPLISRLEGGITNANFRVDVQGDAFVVRIPGRETAALGIDRGREHACTVAAFRTGIGPEVAAFLEPEGVLVTRFIPGAAVTAVDAAMLGRIGASLARVHAGPPFPGSFDPFATVIDYLRRCGPTSAPPDGFASALARAETVSRALKERAPDPRPCHNDLLPANFIDDGSQIRILDWEYAAMGDPFFDLGNLAANLELDGADVTRLLQAYAGAATPSSLARVALMRILSDLRESMWGQLQSNLSDLDFDFAGYARRHLDRCVTGLGDPRFPDWLHAVRAG